MQWDHDPHIQRGRPFGEPRWMVKAADRMGLESSLRPRGRPRKNQTAAERTYESPLGTPFAPILDTSAFACF